MDKFLETYNLPKQNQEEAKNINRPITTTEIEDIIKKLSINKSLGPDGNTGKFYQTFKDKQTPIFVKVFQKIQEEGRFPSSFYEASIILIPKIGKYTTKRENYKPVCLMNVDARIFNKILASQTQQ